MKEQAIISKGSRLSQTAVSPIKSMSMKAEKYSNVLSLGWGLPSFETPLHIRKAVSETLFSDKDIGKYPNIRGLTSLRKALSKKFLEKTNIILNAESEILITVGAQQAMLSSIISIIEPNDEVILFSPFFPSYVDQIIYSGGKPVFIESIFDNNWAINIDKLKSSINNRTKAIIINTPVNPTGKIFSENELSEIAKITIENDLYIILDETYNFLIYETTHSYNLFSIKELKNRLIGCYSFSKEYAMTGWRIGYLCASENLINEILKFHDASVIAATRISQIAALAALEGEQSCVQNFVSELKIRRDLVRSRMDRLSDFFEFHIPNASYFFFPRLRSNIMDSTEFADDLLDKKQVIVIPGNAFGQSYNNHIRICFGAENDTINCAFDRIEDYFRNYYNQYQK